MTDKPKFQVGDFVVPNARGIAAELVAGKKAQVIALGVDAKYIKVLFEKHKHGLFFPAEYFDASETGF